MQDIYDRTLLGNSVPLPEEDSDDVKSDIDFQSRIYTGGIENQEDALREYWFITVLNSIGTSEFKQNYLSVISDIKSECSIREQVLFCEKILERVEEVYEFVFPRVLKLYDLNDIQNVYDFIEFLEYKYEDLIIVVWKFLDVNLRKINIGEYCRAHVGKVIIEIEEQIKVHVLPVLAEQFLRACGKDELIRWFSNISENSKALLILEILKSEVRK